MRVGTTRRTWGEGAVLVFDDSYEHEVRNDCASPRAVFQVVVRHPQLGSDRVRGDDDAAARRPPTVVSMG